MADIYLAISETPTVVTLTSAVINSAVASSVTVTNTVTVALDANSLSALENVTVTVGAAITGTVTVGNSVTISSLPAISGTVTVGNSISIQSGNISIEEAFGYNSFMPISGTVTVGNSVTISSLPSLVAGTAQIGSVTASISNSVTIASLPAISGTVTANTAYATSVTGTARGGVVTAMPVALVDSGVYGGSIMYYDGSNTSLNINVKGSLPSLVAGTAQIGSVTASISNSVTIGSLPAISGTVTANTFALQGTAVTTSNFTSTTASTVLANYNATREVLTIFNEGAGNLHIAPGATCTTIAYQVRLSSGDYYEVPNHQTTITHSAVFATAGTARVTEIT